MAFKLAFSVLCAIFIYQTLAFNLSRKERDTQDNSEIFDSILRALGTSFDEFVSEMENNPVFQNISTPKLEQEFVEETKKPAEDLEKAFKTK